MGVPPSGYDDEVSATHPGAPDEPRKDQDLDRLLRENQELKGRVGQLESAFADLSQRLYRVEASVIFRFLRWLGSKLIRLGVPVAGTVPRSPAQMAVAAREQYAVWAQARALLQTMASKDRSTPSPSQFVTICVDAHEAEPEKLARTLDSLAAQEHRNWELLVCAGPEASGWMEPCVREHTAGHTTEIVGSLDDTCRYRGELVVLLHAHAILDPGALREWLAASAPDVVALYSDWDHIDASGRQYAPRFTPELSRELLSQTPYWGDCYVVRKATLKAARPDKASGLAARHELALCLAETLQPIRRVPRMLWHLQEPPAPIASLANPLAREQEIPVAAQASLIVCSRNPARLNQCLQRLQPALKQRHEIVVVAHSPSGGSAGLERVAARWGARTVPYQGPFHFGEMNRLGVEASRNEVLCLLNDDVYPAAADWLDRMLAQAVRPDVGMVGALLLYPDRTIQHAGIVVGKSWHPAHIGRARVESPFWPWLRMTREVTAVTGACMAMRRAIWDELGGFDFRFPVNYNDVDLCLRAGERGYRVILEARAVMTHEEGQTRVTTVLPEESELFHAIWRDTISAPDRFFNPQLGQVDDLIQLPYPWTLVR